MENRQTLSKWSQNFFEKPLGDLEHVCKLFGKVGTWKPPKKGDLFFKNVEFLSFCIVSVQVKIHVNYTVNYTIIGFAPVIALRSGNAIGSWTVGLGTFHAFGVFVIDYHELLKVKVALVSYD